MRVSLELELAVRRRAKDRCEYCKLHQSLQGATFHVEHVVPKSRGGKSESTNLALACPSCNLHKSDRVEVRDPDSGETIPLFNPRTMQWADHFEWDGFQIEGRTGIGQWTSTTLNFNHPRRIQIREAEREFGLFPPTESSNSEP